MTAPATPAATAADAVELPVLATAVVKARDGRSILDRTGQETARAFRADPDRLHAAVTALTAHGIDVYAIGATAIWFRGARTAVQDAFDVTLEPATKADRPPWAVAPAAADRTTFDAGPLSGSISAVNLMVPPTPAADWPSSDDTTPLRNDLLLGEAGLAMLDAVPPRFTTTDRFPARTLDELRSATTTSLRNWRAHPIYSALAEHVRLLGSLSATDGSGTARPAVPVQVVISGEHGPDSLGYWFDRLAGVPDGEPGVHFTPARRGGAFNPYRSDVRPRLNDALVLSEQAEYARQAVAEVEPLLGQWSRAARPTTQIAAELAGPVREVAGRIGDLETTYLAIRKAKRSLPRGWVDEAPATWGTDAWAPVVAAVDVRNLQQAHAIVTRLDLTRRLRAWATAALRDYDATLAEGRYADALHAAMTTFGALAVAGDLVELVLARGTDFGASAIAERLPRPERGRMVVSMSWGHGEAYVPGPWQYQPNPVVDVLRSTTPSPGALVLVASGNHADGGSEPPNLDAIELGDGTGSLVVGGSTPQGDEWAVSDRTHIYTVVKKHENDPGEYPVTVPSVCGPTRGPEGGGLHFPIPPEEARGGVADLDTWEVGSGSSQATPLVAALSALVWSAFPQLPSTVVREAVRLGISVPTRGRTWSPAFDKSLVRAWDKTGHGRAVLEKALILAQGNAQKPFTDELGTILAPARQGWT